MTAAAGVAVVRRNFPFHIAYDLAEDLVRRGKRIGKTMSPVCSTLDFHVLLDSTVTDPADTLSAYAEYTTRPYLFGANAERGANDSRNSTWDAVCVRVHNFAVIPGGDGGPFPRTRAARIVKLLAEGKHHQGGEGNDRSDSHPVAVTGTDVTADVEWKIAEETVLSNAPLKDLLGGPEALFDLCQLADLLPEAYLDSAFDVDAPAETPALAEATENAKE